MESRFLEAWEPSEQMAEIAEKRGINVTIGTAEDLPFDDEQFDTVIYNGTPSYIDNFEKALQQAYRILKTDGHVLVLDVPKESSYAMLYNLAKETGTWDHPALEGIRPEHAYPIEFVAQANWRTTREKTDLLKKAGFTDLKFAQTLTKHPLYSNDTVEEPKEGFDCGDYVAIQARK